MKSKAWYESKTLWINILMGLAAILAFVAGDAFPVVLTPDITKWLVLALAIVNAVLRLVTDSAVRLK